MPRRPRVEIAGGVHHVTARGNRRAAIFHDDRDRRAFLAELQVVCARYAWRTLTYCLMSNHVHLVIETDAMTLGRGMRQLAGRHAQRLNRRNETNGHVFQGRFWSRPVTSDAYIAQVLRYVALNSVTAGLCSEPGAWRWSAHRELLREARAGTVAACRVEDLLAPYGGRVGTRYARLFEASHPVARRFGAANPWEFRPPLSEILARGDLDAAVRAARDHGYRLQEIASELGVHRATLRRRLESVRRAGSVPG
jgi:REP element-mobilizing transposase RayT